MDEKKEKIARQMREVRARTTSLFDLAREETLHESPGFGFRPILWHLAHIGVFEAYWLRQKLHGEPPLDDRYERIFDPIQTPREESKNLPSRQEMESFLARVRAKALSALDEADFESDEPLLHDGYIFDLVLEHERQHQETLAYLFQMLPTWTKRRVENATPRSSFATALRPTTGEMVLVPAGSFEMGTTTKGFAYDNEYPAHSVDIPAFKIARRLTTNEDYLRFVEEGGYHNRELWSDEGWAHREREGWEHPLYWRRENGRWLERRMFDEGELLSDHPVTGVSWFEAEAYARFCRRRLPTEAEWEKAASWDGERKRQFAWGDEPPSNERCNFDFRFWGTTAVGSFPKGASHYGCEDMTGNLWEWTADSFAGFQGFEPFPYPEYSETWFDGDHCVLKGGSWATSAPVLRTSFRNFFRRNFRIAFAGIRLAENT